MLEFLAAFAVVIIFGMGLPAIVMTILVLAHVPLVYMENENEDS